MKSRSVPLLLLISFLLAIGKPSADVYAAAKPPRIDIPVLNYHSIKEDPETSAEISPEKFEEQMVYLAENGYTTLSLQQFTAIMEGTEQAPDKPVLLTFDDGYADNYVYALPLLKELEFKATLFMSPGMVDDGYFLNWDQIKEMSEAGWDVQPHGMTHPHLTGLKAADQREQLAEAKKQIEEQLGTTADVFCYPYGVYNAATLTILEELGFRYAFTIDQGKTSNAQHPYKLKRLFVSGKESLQRMTAKLVQ